MHAKPIGNWSAAPSAAAVAAAQSGAQEAARAARDANNALKRATLAIQAMQSTQQAARDAARAALNAMPGVNGLGVGGLQIGAGVRRPDGSIDTNLWEGANLPTQFNDGDRTKVDIKQTQQKAILTWDTFNVGGKTDLRFDQSAGGADAKNWIALNRVLDPSAAPSKILGSIKADGQVYVINGNGIIFGGASQINVGTLVASSLSLSNEQFKAGIATQLYLYNDGGGNFVYGKPQFGEYMTTSPLGLPTPFVPSSTPGDVKVEAGASIQVASGGKLMMFAPKVSNAGALTAPDGQIIMAAGENVWLMAPPPVTDGATNTLRGLWVAAGAAPSRPFLMETFQGALNGVSNIVRDDVLPAMDARAAQVGYKVTNTGYVEADRGNITVQGREIQQSGVLLATTALNNRDGSIYLQAYGHGWVGYISNEAQVAHWSGGTLTLTPGSVTSVMPDLTDTSEIEVAALGTRYRPGSVELYGQLIDVQSNASIVVPAGTITAVASKVGYNVHSAPGTGDNSALDGSRIYIDRGAFLSTAGVQDVLLAMESNFIEVDLRINELRDSPLYRDLLAARRQGRDRPPPRRHVRRWTDVGR